MENFASARFLLPIMVVFIVIAASLFMVMVMVMIFFGRLQLLVSQGAASRRV